MFDDGIRETIDWYLGHKPWWENIISGTYRQYYDKMYGSRGLAD
jgi:dTDP-glucose 4,6-dehydratase